MLLQCGHHSPQRHWPHLVESRQHPFLKTCATRAQRQHVSTRSKGRTFVTIFDPGPSPKRERALLSTVSVEDYVHDALHLVELDRVQGVGHLDKDVAFPVDRDD